MLGYLSLPRALGGEGRADVDGLTGREANRHAGVSFPVHRLTQTALPRDPHHDWESVKQQIETPGSDGRPMGGFVASYSTVSAVTPKNAGEVMGYYTAGELPLAPTLGAPARREPHAGRSQARPRGPLGPRGKAERAAKEAAEKVAAEAASRERAPA
jgi:hypothetical protein